MSGSVSGTFTPGHIREFEIGRMRSPQHDNIGPYLDSAAFYEMYTRVKDYENVITQVNGAVSKIRPNFIGDKSDMLKTFNQVLVKRDTSMQAVHLRVELPEEEVYTRVIKVECAPGTKRVGARGTSWKMVIDSRAANRKSWFVLRDYPDLMIRPITDPQLSGRGGKQEWVIANGDPMDTIKVETLRNAELLPIAAPLEENANERGTLDMRGFGSSFINYRFNLTRMGWEKVITDKFWMAANFFQMDVSDADEGVPRKFTLMEMEMMFHNKVRMTYDRYFTAGSSYKPSKGVLTDDMTKRAYDFGPTWIEFMRASGADEYPFYGFNIDYVLDRYQRNMDLSTEDKKDIVYFIVTGTIGYREVLEKEIKRKDKEKINESEYSYKDVPSMGGQGRKGIVTGVKQYMGGFLDPYGEYRIAISSILDKGILCGRDEWMGYPISSSWIIVMIGKKDGADRMSNFTMWTNPHMEQTGYYVGQWTPIGGGAKHPGRFSGGGMTSMQYKVVHDIYKGVVLEDFNEVNMLYPDIKLRHRA